MIIVVTLKLESDFDKKRDLTFIGIVLNIPFLYEFYTRFFPVFYL